VSIDPEEGMTMLDWVLILAPFRKDAAYTASLLQEYDILSKEVSAGNLANRLAEAPGVLVVTHEALSQNAIDTIAHFLREQPTWSEIPIIVLLDRAAPHSRIQRALSGAWPNSRQMFYQRPVVALELISGIQSALLTRLRQREVRDSLDRELELRLELNHRVKNILASVMSLFEMTRRQASTIESFTEDFRGRLTALSNVHSTVFLAGNDEVSLAEVVDLILAPYRSTSGGGVQIAGPHVTLSHGAATTLALCLHELATNAVKYGALSRPEGRVELNWQLSSDSDPALSFNWSEVGGPSLAEPSRVGYGTRYLRSGLRSVFGQPPELEFAPGGLRCSVQGPLSRVRPQPGSL
jgi:two-component sensor histidine kinase